MLIKLDLNGDTLFVKDLGISGKVMSIAVDPSGTIRANVKQYYFGPNGYNTFLFSMTSDGFIFKTDTLPGNPPTACVIGKDSSLVVVGYMSRTGFPGDRSMYFQRVQKDGTLDPAIELNPGHPDCEANRVEQHPNGHYLVSGFMGSRVISYELDELGHNPVFKTWYQTPDLTNLYTGHVSQISGSRYMIAAQGNPCTVGQFDSFGSKYWLRKDGGIQVPPQAMKDSSVLFGYVTGVGLNNTLCRLGHDSTLIWLITIKDSLAARGINGVMQVKAFNYFDDQSAIAAGIMDNGALTDTDPIFIKIANVGTPVTALMKPKKGLIANETLAPWPNPTSGTLYLKQHFDKAEIRLYNMRGKEIGSYKIGFAQPIDVSGYESGVYLYRAVIDGKVYSGKVVKR